MNTWQKHSMLLWKTARESWLFVLLMTVLPAVNRHPHFRGGLPHPEYLVLFPLIGIWGALRSSAVNSREELDRTHLPVSKGLTWFYSCLLPTLVALALGAWAGHWFRVSLPEPLPADRAGIMEGRRYLGLIYGVAFAASYSLAYALTAATSKWIGIVISSLWLFPMDFVWIYGRPAAMEGISIYGTIWVGCTIASLLHLALEGKRSARFRQALTLILVALSFTQPVVGMVRRSLAERVTPSVVFPEGRRAYRSADGSIMIQRVSGHGRALHSRHATSVVEYVNYRAGLRRRQFVKDSWAVLGTVSDRTAYLAQADPAHNMVHIVEWELRGNRLRQIAAIPACAELEMLVYEQTSMDPHGRYIVFTLNSVIGYRSSNLWLLDLRTDTAYLIVNGAWCSTSRAVWLHDRVLIPGVRDYMLIVDLGAKRAHYMPLRPEVN